MEAAQAQMTARRGEELGAELLGRLARSVAAHNDEAAELDARIEARFRCQLTHHAGTRHRLHSLRRHRLRRRPQRHPDGLLHARPVPSRRQAATPRSGPVESTGNASCGAVLRLEISAHSFWRPGGYSAVRRVELRRAAATASGGQPELVAHCLDGAFTVSAPGAWPSWRHDCLGSPAGRLESKHVNVNREAASTHAPQK
ncbi:hypothetical protein ACIA6C_14805 [Streptomyces sp. NPDC051578]|uniref:hypothetical protein n=1 Tax=Streptomyces sp. NPDC051578 TaxID=3365662 RepID=UPI00378D819F